VILVSFVPGILVVLLAYWAVKAGGGRERVMEEKAPPPSSTILHRPPPALIAISLFYLIRMPETLIILHSQHLGVAVPLVPLLWAGVHLVKASTSFVGGALSDRIGPARTMWMGWVSYAALAGGMAFAHGPLAAWILFLALGIVAGMTESPERAIVSAGSGGHRGSAFGMYHALTGVAALVGGITLGVVFQGRSGGSAFFVSASAALVLVILWPFWARAHSVRPR
jgi:MFS family permease